MSTTEVTKSQAADDDVASQLLALVDDDSYLISKARTEFSPTAQRCPPKPK